MAARLKGWRFGVFMGLVVGAIATPLYFTAIRPMINPEPYRQIRADIEPQLRPTVK